MKITFDIPGVEEDQEGSVSLMQQAKVFEAALNIMAAKTKGYGNAWQDQGWMGNLARIMSKTSRLKNMLWQSFDMQSAEESTQDTLLDQINLSAFMVRNMAAGNRWGNGRG